MTSQHCSLVCGLRRRTVPLLFSCQVLIVTVNFVHATTSASIGQMVAPCVSLATLPLFLQMLAAAAGSLAAATLFERLGRRRGFQAGAATSAAGSVASAAGIAWGNFALLCLGAVLSGAAFAVMQDLRFAAADAVTPRSKSLAATLVAAGGVLAAVVAPEFMRITADLMLPHRFLATYLSLAACSLIAALLLYFAEFKPASDHSGRLMPSRRVLRSSSLILAIVVGATIQAVASFLMTSKPPEMAICDAELNAMAAVARAHALAVSVPGLVIGRFVTIIRPVVIFTTGLLLCGVAATVSMTGPGFSAFLGAVVLLGFGQTLMTTGAGALMLIENPVERTRGQVMSSSLVSATSALASLTSSVLHSTLGWAAPTSCALMLPIAVLAAWLLQRVATGRLAAA